MHRFALVPHSDHPARAVTGVAVDLRRRGGSLELGYSVDGATDLVLPDAAAPARTDGLWRTTCFELFLMFDDEEHYVEFNFSPATQWAAYAFTGYRDGMEPLDLPAPPAIERRGDGVAMRLALPHLPHGELRMALTAVIEEAGGVKSYWSLAHPPGAPDFHHPACFAATLPSPDAA